MSEQPEKFLCRKCGSPLDLLLDVDFNSYTPVIEEGGALAVDDIDAFVNFVELIECSNPACGAQWEETGWTVDPETDGSCRLVEAEDD